MLKDKINMISKRPVLDPVRYKHDISVTTKVTVAVGTSLYSNLAYEYVGNIPFTLPIVIISTTVLLFYLALTDT